MSPTSGGSPFQATRGSAHARIPSARRGLDLSVSSAARRLILHPQIPLTPCQPPRPLLVARHHGRPFLAHQPGPRPCPCSHSPAGPRGGAALAATVFAPDKQRTVSAGPNTLPQRRSGSGSPVREEELAQPHNHQRGCQCGSQCEPGLKLHLCLPLLDLAPRSTGEDESRICPFEANDHRGDPYAGLGLPRHPVL